ncbi:MAG: MamI family restriction endonuclease [Acidobacteria bacterium]|nr:MamI family restriction endonuclease [Acidobacteriota bacterium]
MLWDHSSCTKRPRCRVWCVRPQRNRVFRRMCKTWYDKRDGGRIISANFQLHPPRGKDSDEIRNECGNLLYPLLLCAEHDQDGFTVVEYHPKVMKTGECRPSPNK